MTKETNNCRITGDLIGSGLDAMSGAGTRDHVLYISEIKECQKWDREKKVNRYFWYYLTSSLQSFREHATNLIHHCRETLVVLHHFIVLPILSKSNLPPLLMSLSFFLSFTLSLSLSIYIYIYIYIYICICACLNSCDLSIYLSIYLSIESTMSSFEYANCVLYRGLRHPT